MTRKTIAVALAALTAASALGTASAASAQSRGQNDHRSAQTQPARIQPQARGHVQVRQVAPPRVQARTPARTQAASPAYGRWQQAQRRYTAPRYVAPRGYQARQWAYGQRLPAQYRSRTYVVSDYGRYGLRTPPRGHEYVRSGNDVVLAVVATGLITAVIAGLFN